MFHSATATPGESPVLVATFEIWLRLSCRAALCDFFVVDIGVFQKNVKLQCPIESRKYSTDYIYQTMAEGRGFNIMADTRTSFSPSFGNLKCPTSAPAG